MPPPPASQIPIITTINPTSGAAGSYVTFTGRFLAGVAVAFNGQPATVVYSSFSDLVAIVPTGGTTGAVSATNNFGTGFGPIFTYTTSGTPTISTLTPPNGEPGQSIVIAGTNFGATQGVNSKVTFASITAMVTSWSNTSITVNVPSKAITGNVIVTVNGVNSNAVLFTIGNPSNGGTSAPLGLMLIPIGAYAGDAFYTFDPTNFNDPSSPSSYSYKVEEIIAGRTPTCNLVVLQYTDLGVATITCTLSGVVGETDSRNANKVVTASETVQIGTVAATGKICMLTLGISLSAANLQFSWSRAADGGPVSIVKVRLEGTVEK